ncbi:MAG TPA: hypothetical protein VN616_09050 [Puia sp.]|nr:hypothetical protein [Puia sp.]
MGYIKEPKGVDFVVEPHVVTAEDRRFISAAIAHYKATGKFKKAPKAKRTARRKKKAKNKDAGILIPAIQFDHDRNDLFPFFKRFRHPVLL